MSAPGALKASELVTIAGGGKLPRAAAIRFGRADDRLAARFGFRMRVLPKAGPYRTRAVQRATNSSVPPDYSEHCVIVSPVYGPVAAADIDNQRVFRMISEQSFIGILADEGIFFHVLGERWHATIRNTYPAGTAGGNATPLSEKEKITMTDVIYWANNPKDKTVTTASGHAVLPGSMYYQPHPTAQLVQQNVPGKAWDADQATKLEYQAWREHQTAASSTMTGTTTQIAALINRRGLAS